MLRSVPNHGVEIGPNRKACHGLSRGLYTKTCSAFSPSNGPMQHWTRRQDRGNLALDLEICFELKHFNEPAGSVGKKAASLLDQLQPSNYAQILHQLTPRPMLCDASDLLARPCTRTLSIYARSAIPHSAGVLSCLESIEHMVGNEET